MRRSSPTVARWLSSQLGVLGHVRLHEHGADVRVQPGREQEGGHPERPVGQLPVVVGQGDGVQVDHRIEGVEFVLHVHPLPERPDVVADVEPCNTFRLDLLFCQGRRVRGTRLDA
jgi:hypothetical protein